MTTVSNRVSVMPVRANDVDVSYPLFFQRVMGQWDKINWPEIIYFVHDREVCVGFFAGSKQDAVTFHVQASGVVPEYRGPWTLAYCQAGMAALHAIYRFLSCRIDRDNAVALRMALKAGWRITGTHLATDGTLMVGLRSEAGHG